MMKQIRTADALFKAAYQATSRNMREAETRYRHQSFKALCTAHSMAALGSIILALSFQGLSHASAPVTRPAPSPAKQETIMVYGDSLSAAYGMQPEQGWVALLTHKLKADAKTAQVRVINASISGETTSGGRARIRADLAANKPTIVLVALGANDGLRGLAVTEARANLRAILDAIQTANARAVIVGIQIPPNYGIDYARDFRDLFPALARARKLPLVPFLLDGIADNLDLFQADRLHPIAAAQPRILHNVWATLQPLLTPKPLAKHK